MSVPVSVRGWDEYYADDDEFVEYEWVVAWSEFASHMQQHLPKDGAILEVGCGNSGLVRLVDPTRACGRTSAVSHAHLRTHAQTCIAHHPHNTCTHARTYRPTAPPHKHVRRCNAA